ncbi:GntR family transcriptional regulator [Pseudanabaena sp. PCC 6802]|uniref:GntR family transcriptional regulator n=1 Tax=Pseudanabaena sp. PCC 6802 TaxID=118173 RepID=UPI00034DFF7E|nr:GntR family transcriptional regulator [Pseudanabaena sp. PCC 6802]
MVQFFIKADSEISASTQLYDQLSFAITTRQYQPGQQLPSTRQLAQWTGLHRNTINKVYQQLKQTGMVEARGGSGIYVSDRNSNTSASELPLKLLRECLDKMLAAGCSLAKAKELMSREVDWRLSFNAQLLVVSGHEDPGIAKIMAMELGQALDIPIQIVPLEDLPQVLEHTSAGTVVTNRFYLDAARKAAGSHNVRVIAIDIYNYSKEIQRIRDLPAGSYVGLVSISTGALRLAESLIHSIRGDDILVVSVLPQDTYRLQTVARSADLAIAGHSGRQELDEAIAIIRPERIRPLEVIYCDNYIASESIELLKLELGLA